MFQQIYGELVESRVVLSTKTVYLLDYFFRNARDFDALWNLVGQWIEVVFMSPCEYDPPKGSTRQTWTFDQETSLDRIAYLLNVFRNSVATFEGQVYEPYLAYLDLLIGEVGRTDIFAEKTLEMTEYFNSTNFHVVERRVGYKYVSATTPKEAGDIRIFLPQA